MSRDWSAVYDVLVKHAGASEAWRESFLYVHRETECDEFRFQGRLGFGGKYRSKRNAVDCYREDMTPKRHRVIVETNAALAALLEPKS